MPRVFYCSVKTGFNFTPISRHVFDVDKFYTPMFIMKKSVTYLVIM